MIEEGVRAISGFFYLLGNLLDPHKQNERRKHREYKITKRALYIALRIFEMQGDLPTAEQAIKLILAIRKVLEFKDGKSTIEELEKIIKKYEDKNIKKWQATHLKIKRYRREFGRLLAKE